MPREPTRRERLSGTWQEEQAVTTCSEQTKRCKPARRRLETPFVGIVTTVPVESHLEAFLGQRPFNAWASVIYSRYL